MGTFGLYMQGIPVHTHTHIINLVTFDLCLTLTHALSLTHSLAHLCTLTLARSHYLAHSHSLTDLKLAHLHTQTRAHT